MSDILLLAIAVLVNFCLMMYFCIRQHRKTKQAALMAVEHEWALEVGRAESEAIKRVGRRIEDLTLWKAMVAEPREKNRAE